MQVDFSDTYKWENHDTYYLNLNEQRTAEWFSARLYRITSSFFSDAVQHTMYRLPDDLARTIKGQSPRLVEIYTMTGDKKLVPVDEVDPGSKFRMEMGQIYEVAGRNWYISTTGYQVREVGLAVWKENVYLGASTDGIVIDSLGNEIGLIEVKLTERIYPSLKLKKDSDKLCMHISRSHYDQMQGAMGILNKSWYDYIVVVMKEPMGFYKERIIFNEVYFRQELLSKLQVFIDKYLKD